MDVNGSVQSSYLDNVRLQEGLDKCDAAFIEIYKKSGAEAVALVNDRRLSFPCFYVLLPRIKELRINRYLNSRNITAMRIINQILRPKGSAVGSDYLSTKKNRVYTVLKWILETGADADGYDDDYEEILDVTVSVLLGTYKDKSIVPTVADMIFKRGKIGHLIHDLVWVLFKSEDPQALRLIANRLKSPDREEVQLAYELLNIEDLDIKISDRSKRDALYEAYIKWLEENDPFLYFTEEGYQYKSAPVFSAVDMERKYLNKTMTARKKQPLTSSDENEDRCLQAFKTLSNEEKSILSGYSRRVHDRNAAEWESWLRSPVDEQLKAAKREREGWF